MVAEPRASIKFVNNLPFNHTIPLMTTPYFSKTEPAGETRA